MFPFRSHHSFILLAALALAACGGATTPRLIGAYPQPAATAIAVAPIYPPPPANLLVVYNADLTLDVFDVDTAAAQATQTAYNCGGYLAGSQSWTVQGRKYTTITLAAPVAQFDSLRSALLRLGTLVVENVSGDLQPTGYGQNQWNTFSYFTVQLRSAAPAWSAPPIGPVGWSPIGAAQQAFGLFVAVFIFLADVAIWVAIVVGPFVLMGVGARALWRRLRAR